MISFWERESLMKWDKIIIGGGLLGLWTAYHCLKESPN
jgi:glycine/D-amino acid oxidase-like deaminating enzyme